MLTVDPHTLEEVLASVGAVGVAVGREAEAARLVTTLRQRLDAVGARVAGRRRPRVAVLEWTDPPFAPGHWIPEMVQLAGGECVLGAAGERSVAIGWEDLAASTPEVVVVAPCGYDREGAQRQADALVAAGVLPDGVVVHAVDADGLWARPGPRLVDGVEELAGLLHPADEPRCQCRRSRWSSSSCAAWVRRPSAAKPTRRRSSSGEAGPWPGSRREVAPSV